MENSDDEHGRDPQDRRTDRTEKPQGARVATGEPQAQRWQEHAERRRENLHPLAHLIHQPVTFDEIAADAKRDVEVLPDLVGDRGEEERDRRDAERHRPPEAVGGDGRR